MTDHTQELKDIAAEIASLQTRNRELCADEITAHDEANEVRETIQLLKERQKAITDEIEEEAGNPNWPKRYNFYLHSSKEGNYEEMKEKLEDAEIYIDEDDEFWHQICYACYEIEINCLVHRNGSVEIVGIDGKKLSKENVDPTDL